MAERVFKGENPTTGGLMARAALFAAASAAALIAGGLAAAQTSADPIAYCRKNTDGQNERIACLEAAIRSLTGGEEKSAEAPEDSTPALAEAAPAPAAEPAAEPPGLGAEQVARRKRSETPASRVAEAEETETSEQAEDAAEASRVAEAAPTGLGAEQVIAKQERETEEGRKKRKARRAKEAVTATLIDFARTSTGRLILVLDNGQVWAQRTSDRQTVRLRDGDKPSVKIRRGALSGYRMELSDPNVTITVERLK